MLADECTMDCTESETRASVRPALTRCLQTEWRSLHIFYSCSHDTNLVFVQSDATQWLMYRHTRECSTAPDAEAVCQSQVMSELVVAFKGCCVCTLPQHQVSPAIERKL